MINQFIFEGLFSRPSKSRVKQFDIIAVLTPSNKKCFLDFRLIVKISAFLFAGLIFFVTFLHQGKKVKALYSKGNFRTK
ncbi:MAG: hypothetical protein EBZ95_08955 [Chitinophagia bacterium]|nr:hypothetical protein [Chitinophagia bacterium]